MRHTFELPEPRFPWFAESRAELQRLGSDDDRFLAEKALRRVAHLSPEKPRIYNAPEGGIVLEFRASDGILTLVIEGSVGGLVRSGEGIVVQSEFLIDPYSIEEISSRFEHEARLLFQGA